MKKTNSECPPTLIYSQGQRGLYAIIAYNIEEMGEGYEYDEVSFLIDHHLTEGDYGTVVSAIIRDKYSQDDVEAILNNYVAEKTAEHNAEWEELQSWRRQAKEIARRALEHVNKNV